MTTSMTLGQAFVLGVLQGATEFLPVSSSGHLVLAETWFGLRVEELLIFDVVVHAGTLVALLVYFWKDLWEMLESLWKPNAERRQQLMLLIVATIPIVLFGPFLKDILQEVFRSQSTVMAMLAWTAFLLALAEILGKKTKGQLSSLKVAFLMGCFQLMAVIPGISRSGSTMVGGLLGGLKREAAARFAFLMAVPAIGGATVFLLKDLLDPNYVNESLSTGALVVGFLSSVVVSFICMYGMLKFLRQRSLWVFVAYLVLLNLAWMFF